MLPKIKKMLYTTDLSPNSGIVMRYAINSAKMHHAKIVVLHVLEELPPTSKALVEQYVDKDMLRQMVDKKYAYYEDIIRARIHSICEKELNKHPDEKDIFESIELVEGHPADEILIKADELDCDAIIMGVHGKGLLKHTYFGSNCKKVLHQIRKPVFIVPLPEGETDVTFNE
jgi:nucleotide-binding universal stress UspA family protein